MKHIFDKDKSGRTTSTLYNNSDTMHLNFDFNIYIKMFKNIICIYSKKVSPHLKKISLYSPRTLFKSPTNLKYTKKFQKSKFEYIYY